MASKCMRKSKKSPIKTQLLRQIFDYSDLVQLEEEIRQCIVKNNITSAVLCMEKRLHLHREYFGPHSEELYKISREYCEFCHDQALVALQKNDFIQAKKFLLKAEASVFENEPLQLAIYKTMAHYLRAVNQLRASMDFLKKAKRLVMRNPMKYQVDQIEILLNLCSIASQIGKHQNAYQYAQQALVVIQENWLFVAHKDEKGSDSKERSVFLAVAYHNLAVEEEFLQEHTKSFESFRKAVAIAETELGPTHPMTKSMNVSLLAAEEALEKKTLQQVYPMYTSSHMRSSNTSRSSSRITPYFFHLADAKQRKQIKNKKGKVKYPIDRKKNQEELDEAEEFAEWDGTSRPSTASSLGASKFHQEISHYNSPKQRALSLSNTTNHAMISSAILDAYGNIDFGQGKHYQRSAR
jgi:tetratricopeptide (TPR) repeat protein